MITPHFSFSPPLLQPSSKTMSSQNNDRGADPPARTKQKTLLDDVILTFSSPMAWLLVVALLITWFGVAIVLFDLLNYKALTGNTRVFVL